MALSAFERLVIRRYIVPRSGERIIVLVASISLIAVTLGVAALVIVSSVMNGYQKFILDTVIETTGHAIVRGPDGSLEGWQGIAAAARKTPGVTEADPMVEARLMGSSAGRVAPVRVRGLPRERIATPALRAGLLEGTADLGPEGGSVIIGSELARILPASAGGTIELVTVGEKPDGELDVRPVSFRIAGVVETKAPDFDREAVLMPVEEAQALMGLGAAVTSLVITTADPRTADVVLAPLAARLPQGVKLNSWKVLNAELFTALAVDEVGMFLVLSIIILVAVFNILSALVMLVRAKVGDIAIMRTMGASRGAMLRIFMAIGTTIGALGTAGGLVLGLVFLRFREPIGIFIQMATQPSTEAASNFLVSLPADVKPVEIAVIGVSALVLSILATLYPALRAAGTDPVRVLKGG
ncbi:MAG TPA: FtsX-like permease family protein [Allosphingosinicella sp.]|jgi:lipoprotein-releasing system permease protein